MASHPDRRRLFWHAILLFFLGLIEGMFIQAMRNPRVGLSAHVGTLMSGIFLGILGALWGEIRLAPRVATATVWLALYGMYVSSAGLTLAGVFGTGRSTPIGAAGRQAAEWQEAVVNFALTSGAVAALLCCVGVLWGLRRRASENEPPRAQRGRWPQPNENHENTKEGKHEKGTASSLFVLSKFRAFVILFSRSSRPMKNLNASPTSTTRGVESRVFGHLGRKVGTTFCLRAGDRPQ